MWFSFGKVDIAEELRGIHHQLRKIGFNMASIAQVRADYKAFAQELKDQRDAAIALADRALAQAAQSASDLATFQADDAMTDASQLAAQADEFANQFQTDLHDLKRAPEPTPPVDNPQAGDGTDETDTTAPVQPEPTPSPEVPAEPVAEEAAPADVPAESTARKSK